MCQARFGRVPVTSEPGPPGHADCRSRPRRSSLTVTIVSTRRVLLSCAGRRSLPTIYYFSGSCIWRWAGHGLARSGSSGAPERGRISRTGNADRRGAVGARSELQQRPHEGVWPGLAKVRSSLCTLRPANGRRSAPALPRLPYSRACVLRRNWNRHSRYPRGPGLSSWLSGVECC
jgi:hypothetical protein